jgi:predicted Zn-dependent protease
MKLSSLSKLLTVYLITVKAGVNLQGLRYQVIALKRKLDLMNLVFERQ